MITTFRLGADDLDLSILKSIKQAFKGRNIEIIISDIEAREDSTKLLHRIENLRKNKNIIIFSEENFFKTYRKKTENASSKI